MENPVKNYEIVQSPWHHLGLDLDLPVSSVFAIGDVHGHFDLLRAMHDHVNKLIKNDDYASEDKHVLVHLGDIIDRGPKSVAALRYIFSLKIPKLEIVNLPGNHEQFMVAAINNLDPDTAYLWLTQGGKDVIQELDIIKNFPKWQKHLLDCDDQCVPFIKSIKTALGETWNHVIGMPTSYRIGNLVCVHAGVPYGWTTKNLEDYDWRHISFLRNRFDENLSPLWVRDPFLNNNAPMEDGTIICHGHTIFKNPVVTPRRISIDTGAYRHGRLTMAEYRNNSVRFHTTIPVF